MNQLKNGTLLVAVATVVTVILILMTGRDEAKIPSTHEETIATTESTPNEAVVEAPALTQENSTEITSEEPLNTTTEVTQKLVETATESQTVVAPEGPFSKSSDKANQSTEMTDNSNTAPKTSTQHELLNHIVQPIWLDQKLGDFKSVEKGEVVFKLMPTNPDGLQGNSPEQVITSKSDKFAPTSIPANYNYQQMPMYNGGYYIAPMPSYLMPSMLPGQATTRSNKEAKTEN